MLNTYNTKSVTNRYYELCNYYGESKVESLVNLIIGSRFDESIIEAKDIVESDNPESVALNYGRIFDNAHGLTTEALHDNLDAILTHLDILRFNEYLIKKRIPWIIPELSKRLVQTYPNIVTDYQNNKWKIESSYITSFIRIPLSLEANPDYLQDFSNIFLILVQISTRVNDRALINLVNLIGTLPFAIPSFLNFIGEFKPTIPELLVAIKMFNNQQHSESFKTKISSLANMAGFKYRCTSANELYEFYKFVEDPLTKFSMILEANLVLIRKDFKTTYKLISMLSPDLQMMCHFNDTSINIQRFEYLENPIKSLGKGYSGLKRHITSKFNSNYPDFAMYTTFVLYSIFHTKDRIDKFTRLLDIKWDKVDYINYFSDYSISNIKIFNDPQMNSKLGIILLKYPKLLKFPNLSYLVQAYDEVGLNSEYTLKEYAYKLLYSELDLRNSFEQKLFEISQQYNYQMKYIDQIMNAYRLRKDESYLDGIEVTHDKYKLVKMSVDDPRTYFAGEDTNCCYTFDSAAKTCIRHSIINPNSDTYELINTEDDSVILNMWVYIVDDIVVIDSVESRFNEIDPELLFEIFIDFVNQIKDSGFSDVRISKASYGITPQVVEALQNYFNLIEADEIAKLDDDEQVTYFDSKYGQYVILKPKEGNNGYI